MEFELSRHAIEQMTLRGISVKVVHEVLNNPDKIIPDGIGQVIYQAIVIQADKTYLIRIFVNSEKTPNLVKTVYRTSKLSKYT
ncbi:DUF4258 domain-containing protein [Larkinella terrae]|uniref:DUF4258 domain-containing protein n=1 Tax=Larkinella terrae TaxID=2025311 RepID=A0A7K0EH69_9BACT|nr:DUF4258 domain-containing protein [Larkinella terrae]MRS61062.1 DUF4258 domain-containing protein [Larkinella terrae]